MTAPLCSVPRALTIAGSDSGGGAGIQADLKTFAALSVYGASALTAVTAQNTRSVQRVEELSVAMVAAQIDAVLEDIGANAVKTGMLASAPIIAVVAARLRQHTVRVLVVDPVMVAKGGARLLREDAVATLCRELLSLALVVTPTIPEAEVLAGMTITSDQDTLAAAARRIAAYGPRYVLLKGGHLPGEQVVDRLWDASTARFAPFVGQRIATTSTHGTGCTLSAAIAAGLALGQDVPAAVAAARVYTVTAIGHAQPIGHGHGPLHHFWATNHPPVASIGGSQR